MTPVNSLTTKGDPMTAQTRAHSDLVNHTSLMQVQGMAVSYGSGDAENKILQNLNLEVADRQFISIVGPSGVGKTTLLRALSGLLPPKAGTIKVNGHSITGPHEDVAVVFQDYSRSLLPWMSTRENIAFPLQGKGLGKLERLRVADENLRAVGLEGQGDKYPWEMSGGMQQRVAIARALAYNAKVLLMDEPFASVDAQTRFDLEDLVLKLKHDLGVTIILVTHDIDEALYLADKVVVIAEKPATVVDEIEIGLGERRDQIETKADPRFAEARARILHRLRKN